MGARLFAAARVVWQLFFVTPTKAKASAPQYNSVVVLDRVLDALCSSLTGATKRSSLRRQVMFLRRLVRDGLLARDDDGAGRLLADADVVDNHPPTSLEHAIATGLVKPPPLDYVCNRLDMTLFETALPTLRKRWRKMWRDKNVVCRARTHSRRSRN